MVTAATYRSVDGIQRTLEQQDLGVMAPLAVLGAGGVFLSQEVIDFVMPNIGMSEEPSNVQELSVAATVKLVLAVALVLIGNRLGYGGLGAVIAVGALISAGADGIDLLQQGLNEAGLVNSSTRGRSRSRSRSRSSSSRSRSSRTRSRGRSRATASSGVGSKTMTGGGSASSPRSRRREKQTWG